MNRQHMDVVFVNNAVNDPVAVEKELANVVVFKFGNHPTKTWMICQPVSGLESLNSK